MNIFIIPSWYPSKDEPNTGIFFKEQAVIYAEHFQEDHIGISTWGQNDHRLLLPLSDIHKWVIRWIRKVFLRKQRRALLPNCIEYFNPTFSWTRRVLDGNMKNTIAACEENLLAFQEEFGSCDVLHAHVAYPGGYVAKCLSEKFGIPFMITEHMGPFPLPALADVFQSHCLVSLKKASLVLAVSGYLKKEMAQFQVESEVFHNFIDDELFQPREKEIGSPIFTFLTIGRLEQEKGHDALIGACALIDQHDFQLKIIGFGSLEKELRLLIEDKRLTDKVFLEGAADRMQVERALRDSDAFVFPSHFESFGVAALEALACGKPLISTAAGEAGKMLNQETGILIPEVKPESIAECMERMMENQASFTSERIRGFYMRNYSAALATTKLRSHYERLVSSVA